LELIDAGAEEAPGVVKAGGEQRAQGKGNDDAGD
jgi:hypothetical protein